MQVARQQIFRLIFILAGVCLGTAACEPDVVTRGDFYYLNSSGFDVLVERYSIEPDTTTRLEVIEIRKKREYKRRIDFEGPDNIACEDFKPPLESDSLVFIYSNDSIVSYNLLDTTSGNPLLLRNYRGVKVARNFCEFRFTIN